MQLPTVTLALRAAGAMRGERLLVIGAPGESVVALDQATGGTAHFFFTDHAAHRNASIDDGRRSHGAWYAGRGHDAALIFLPKGKRRRDLWLAMAGAALADDGRVYLIGQKDEGIKSADDAVATYFAAPVGGEPGAHARLLSSSRPRRDRQDGVLDAWFVDWEVSGLRLRSLPGTFSEGRLDVGSQFLLAHWTPPAEGTLLDVGCGAGVLGLLAARAGATATLVDSDELAVESARQSVGQLPAIVLASDVYSAVGGGFAQIVSNPPFHQGVRTEYSVASRIVQEAPAHLIGGGELWLVANGHLPYAEIIQSAFGNCRVVARDRQFAVYQATKSG